jgi:hypothetical protein
MALWGWLSLIKFFGPPSMSLGSFNPLEGDQNEELLGKAKEENIGEKEYK